MTMGVLEEAVPVQQQVIIQIILTEFIAFFAPMLQDNVLQQLSLNFALREELGVHGIILLYATVQHKTAR
jgi:hypothetical protein